MKSNLAQTADMQSASLILPQPLLSPHNRLRQVIPSLFNTSLSRNLAPFK
jgi:hypothetical protein